MNSKPSTKPSWTTSYSKSNMPSQESYQQPKEPPQSEWSALESQKDTAAELKQKIATAAQIEIPEDVVDKEAYRHSQDYYANMCQSVFAAAFDNPPEGLSEDDIKTATIDVLVDESQKFIADGGKMSGNLDELLFPDQDLTEEESAMLAHYEDSFKVLREARLKQYASESMQSFQSLAQRFDEARKNGTEMPTFRFSEPLRRLKQLKQYDTDNTSGLDSVFNYVQKNIVPNFYPNQAVPINGRRSRLRRHSSSEINSYSHLRINRGFYMDKLLDFAEGMPELLDDAPENVRSCIRFLNNSKNELSNQDYNSIKRITALGLYGKGGEATLFDENGKPTEEFQVAIMLDPVTIGTISRHSDKPDVQEFIDSRKELCKKYLNEKQLKVMRDLAEQNLEKPLRDEILASLYLENNPAIYAAKLKAANKINNADFFGTDAIEILAQINTPEDADLPIEELKKRAESKLFHIGYQREHFPDTKPYDRMHIYKAYEELIKRFDKQTIKGPDGFLNYDNIGTNRRIFEQYLLAAIDGEKKFHQDDLDAFIGQIEAIEQIYNDTDIDLVRRMQILRQIAQSNEPINNNSAHNTECLYKNAKNFLAAYNREYDPFGDDSVFTTFLGLEETGKYEISEESINGIEDLINQITYSNSNSLQRLMAPIISEFLRSGNYNIGEDGKLSFDYTSAKEKLEKIETIFLRNNLPPVAKNFLVFKTIHPMEQFKRDFVEGAEYKLSPTLAQAEVEGPFGSYGIILRNLIKSSLESNDITMRKYLENMRDGQKILDNIKSGETTYDELDEASQQTITNFIKHIATLYNQTKSGQESPVDANLALTKENIQTLEQTLRVRERDSIADRAVRYFGFTAGLHGVEDALRRMDQNREAANQRNRETAKHPLIIHRGDLIKNVNGKYLDNILMYGSNSKEFLGEDADTDQTALDTDVTMRLGEDAAIQDCTEIQDNPNGNYGYVWFVIENTPDRFRTTRQDDGHPGEVEDVKLSDNRLELFQTGVLGESHYGIGVGFGSEHIKAMVIEQSDSKNLDEEIIKKGEYLDRTCFRIVKNGFYIPVYDRKTGQLLFTEEQYDKMRAQLSGNPEYETGPYRAASTEDFNNDVERIAQLGLGQEIDTVANKAEVDRKDKAIRDAITAKLLESDPGLRDYIDGDVVPGVIEVSSTGSTGRGTNIPGDGDFDYIFRVDRDIYADSERMSQLANRIKSAIHMTAGVSKSRSGGVSPYDIRTKHVHVDGLEDEVDIDITFIQRTDKITYATENAVRDYLDNLEGAEHDQAIKNIIAAKKLFKQYECYKPKHAGDKDEVTNESLAQGGLGGIGTENWILQNGGSLTAAARNFLQAAGLLDQNGQRISSAEPTSFTDFVNNYQIWDLGANHTSERKGRYPHDNFIANNLDETGYQKITKALLDYLGV